MSLCSDPSRVSSLREIAIAALLTDKTQSPQVPDIISLNKLFRKIIDSGVLEEEAKKEKFRYRIKCGQILCNESRRTIIREDYPCLLWGKDYYCQSTKETITAYIETTEGKYLSEDWKLELEPSEETKNTTESSQPNLKSGETVTVIGSLQPSLESEHIVSHFSCSGKGQTKSLRLGVEIYMVFAW